MTSMLELIKELWFLKRDIVSDDFDKALNTLLGEIDPDHTAIHEYPTGEQCWTWRVPEKWTCHEAYLETLDGKRLIDYTDHPLHVVSYSLPYEGIVERSELLEHIHAHPKLEQAIPFVFKYYERDWGLCTTQKVKASLTEESYRVVIRTSFNNSTLKVGEIIVPGKSEETIMLVAHLCHPAMVNDDLSGVVVGLDAVKSLLENQDLHYTYRLLILPETIGSVAYLSHNENLIPKMVGGLFLEMLGNDSPHALQQSFQPNSQIDRCFITALRSLDPDSYYAPYRTVICNDERQFNAPGVRVPMLSLSRVEPADSGARPYREYHSSLDTPEIITPERLEESKEILLGLIDAFENNYYVINQFKGEIFCSGYGIWVDYRSNPEGHKRLFEIMEKCDGEKTIADIAFDLDISFQSVWEIIQILKEKELVRLSRTPESTSPHRKHF
jgi:aminopeptidase-like protein